MAQAKQNPVANAAILPSHPVVPVALISARANQATFPDRIDDISLAKAQVTVYCAPYQVSYVGISGSGYVARL